MVILDSMHVPLRFVLLLEPEIWCEFR